MLDIPLDKIIKKICAATDVSKKLVRKKITDKKKELNGLVSDEGAAYVVASEMGVDILDEVSKKKMKIKDVLIGMRSVVVKGRVLNIFDVNEFKRKDGSEGKVGAFMLGDETGKVRVVVWDKQVKILKKIEEGMALKVSGAYSRENRYSGVELHLGKRSKLAEIEKSDLPAIEELRKVAGPRAGAAGEQRRGTVVQVYKPGFYDVCAECGKSVKSGPCSEHKDADSKKAMVLSFVLDNGKKAIRCAAFRDVAEKIASLKAKKAREILVDKNEAALTEKLDGRLLGRIVKVSGRLQHNKDFERDEIMVNDCELDIDPKEVISELENQ